MYIRFNNNDYYNTMLSIPSMTLRNNAEKAAAYYLTDNLEKHRFLKEINDIRNKAESICNSTFISDREKLSTIKNMEFESNSLEYELKAVMGNLYKKYLYIEAERIEKYQNIVIKGASLIGGIGQIILGSTLVYAPYVNVSGGAAYGVMLVAHGSNNVYESLDYFVSGNVDSSGYVRDFYRESAKLFGETNNTGDIIYASVDIGLSARAMAGKFQVPSSRSLISTTQIGPFKFRNYDSAMDGRLFNALDAQYKRGIVNMGKFAISLEVFNDIMSFKSIKEKY